MKGTHYLVQAFERMNAESPRHRLTVLGPGVRADIVMAAFPAALRDLVRVIDRGPEDDVVRALRTHDVLLWPSTYEGFGLVLIEAMSQRLAVVATPAGCAASVVRDGVNGLLVAPRDAEWPRLGGRASHGRPALRRRLGSAAREAVAV